MIYEVKKNDVTLQIDDNVLFPAQSKEFRQMYEAGRIVEFKDEKGKVINTMLTNNAEFDNCYIEVNVHGRLIISYKIKEYAEI